jgi:hypothetical protein
MTRIQTTCPSCGARVQVPLGAIVLADDRTGPAYVLPCPECHDVTVKLIDDTARNLLVAAGAVVPSGVPEHPESPPTGPVFTPDDLLDLHFLLERPDWFDRLLGVVSPRRR